MIEEFYTMWYYQLAQNSIAKILIELTRYSRILTNAVGLIPSRVQNRRF